MKVYQVVGVLAVSLLFGCTAKIVMVDFNLEADNYGKNGLTIKADGSKLTTETDQASDGRLAAGLNGGTGALTGAGDIKDLASQLLNDFSKKDSENPTTTTTTTTTTYKENEDNIVEGEPVTEEVDPGVEGTSEDLDYKNKATYTSYGVRNGGRQAWRIAGKGPSFGDKIKIIFSDGSSFLINDTSKNCRDNQETCERDSSAAMRGLVFKPGIGPNGDGDGNTGTSHGGVYLHAPYGNKSTKATFYFNKP